jgi:hypothetical protein
MTRWSWMTLSNGKIGLVLLVYASPDVDGLHESPRDSAPMYVTRSPVVTVPSTLGLPPFDRRGYQPRGRPNGVG